MAALLVEVNQVRLRQMGSSGGDLLKEIGAYGPYRFHCLSDLPDRPALGPELTPDAADEEELFVNVLALAAPPDDKIGASH